MRFYQRRLTLISIQHTLRSFLILRIIYIIIYVDENALCGIIIRRYGNFSLRIDRVNVLAPIYNRCSKP